MFSNFQINSERYAGWNVFFAYLFLPFLPTLLPYYKIEPVFTCHNHNYSGSFGNYSKICEMERICNNEFDDISEDLSYYSFKTSYYLREEGRLKMYCNGMNSIDYCILFYFVGVYVGNILYNKIREKEFLLCISIGVTLIINYAFVFIYLYSGVEINSGLIFFCFNFGFNFFLFSSVIVSFYAENKNVIKTRIDQDEVFSVGLDILPIICGIVHIGLYNYYKDYKVNFLIFFLCSFISYTLHCGLIYSKHIEKKAMLRMKKTRNKTKSDFMILLNRCPIASPHSPKAHEFFSKKKGSSNRSILKVNLSKSALLSDQMWRKKEKNTVEKVKKIFYSFSSSHYPFILNCTLFLIASTNYQVLNYYTDIYTYKRFNQKTEDILFLNGYIIYLAELFAIFSASSVGINSQSIFKSKFLPLILVLLLGISLTILEVCVKSSSLTCEILLTFFIFLVKIFSMYIALFLKNLLQRDQGYVNHKNGKLLTILSRFSIVISFIIINFCQFPFLILACMYYICFLLSLKLIL